jgi:hypothetical protein
VNSPKDNDTGAVQGRVISIDCALREIPKKQIKQLRIITYFMVQK